jgi:uncharacterized surface protein with fasciclin (FAS1) repeats
MATELSLITGYNPLGTEASRQAALLRNLTLLGDKAHLHRALAVMEQLHMDNKQALNNIALDRQKVENHNYAEPKNMKYTRPNAQGQNVEEHNMSSRDMTVLEVLGKNTQMFSQYLNIVAQARKQGCYKPDHFTTYFVTTNNGFVRMSDNMRAQLSNWEPSEFIAYNSVNGPMYTYDMKGTRLRVKTKYVPNPNLAIEGRGPQIRLGLQTEHQYAHIIQGDIVCSDGIIMVIDGVLLPGGLSKKC